MLIRDEDSQYRVASMLTLGNGLPHSGYGRNLKPLASTPTEWVDFRSCSGTSFPIPAEAFGKKREEVSQASALHRGITAIHGSQIFVQQT